MNVFIVFVLGMFMASGAVATEPQTKRSDNQFELLLGLGLSYGGDDLLKAYYEGAEGSESLKAGNFFDIKAGAVFNISQRCAIQSSIGYHIDRIEATNGKATFSRYPLDVLGLYKYGKHRVGAGISYHLNAKYDEDFERFGLDDTVKMKNALGMVFEYGYRILEPITLAVRYMDIGYEADTLNGMTLSDASEIDGSHFGIYLYFSY